jgi:hypothetical protein
MMMLCDGAGHVHLIELTLAQSGHRSEIRTLGIRVIHAKATKEQFYGVRR